MKTPLISVVIPTYNRAASLLEAVGSVLEQSFRDFDLIVVDDGSTDDTAGRLHAGKKDERLKYLRLEHGGTPGRARNRGAAEARGRYIAFLDSDDLWLPEKLERQLALFAPAAPAGLAGEANSPAPRIAHTRELWLRSGREVSQAGQRHKRAGDIFADSLVKCVIGPSTSMMEKSLFDEAGGFREDLEIAEDYELWLRITAGEKAAYLDEPLTVKRAGAGDQLSEKYGQIEIFRIRALKDLVDRDFFASRPEKGRAAREELARKCAIYSAGCRKRGKSSAEYEILAEKYASDALVTPAATGDGGTAD